MTTIRTLALGFIATSALVVAAGCSAEAPSSEEVQASISEGAVDTTGLIVNGGAGNLYSADCVNGTTTSLKQATQLLKYAFGDDAAVTFANTAACGAVQSSLLALRSAMNNSQVTVANWTGLYTVCDWTNRTQLYRLEDQSNKGTVISPIITSLQANVTSCFGPGVIAYLVPGAATGKWAYMYMDPEPATLSANLGASAGASASAYYTDSGFATTVRTWGSNYASCSNVVTAGQTCSLVPLAAGDTATRMIQKNNTQCRCL
jgi:hypothetical protein